jgi:hypothetical protein
MSPSRRFAYGAVVLSVASLLVGCATTEDEVGATGSSTTFANATTTTTSGEFELPQPDPNVRLDTATKTRCDSLWAFQLFQYSAHKTGKPEHAEGIKKHQAAVAKSIPELAEPTELLAAHALTALEKRGQPSPMTDELSKANREVLGYMRTTCKMV